MAVCHNCGVEFPDRPAKRNRSLPDYCMAELCRREYRKQFYSYRPKGLTAKCESCGGAVRQGARFCAQRVCRAAYHRSYRGAEKIDERGWACETCKFADNCGERVKVGMWVVCETPDERDLVAAQISPHYDRMVELIAEARAM